MRLSEHCYALCGFEDIVNAGFIAGREGVVVVDTTMFPYSARSLLDFARAVAPGKPVRAVINTHWHADHVFGNQVFASQGTSFISHQNTIDTLNSIGDYPGFILQMAEKLGREPKYFERLLAEVKLTLPQETVRDRHVIDLGDVTVAIHHLPGHTRADLAVMVPEDEVVFAGDLLYPDSPPNVKFGNPKVWAASLTTVLEWNPRSVLPGHGRPCGSAAIAEQRDFLAGLTQAARELWRAGQEDLAEYRRRLGVSLGSARRLLGIVSDGLEWPS